MRIALFITCIGDTLFPEAGRATVQVLEQLGHEVAFPEEQTCCGQMHVNSGYREDGLALARRFVRIFEPFEAVVSPSSSCIGNVREVFPALAHEARDEELAVRVAALGQRVFELSELLVHQLGVEDVGATFAHRVAYHPTCHSLRVTRVGDAPLRLLRAVHGLELVPLRNPDECCGFGGTFSLKNAETSSAMLHDKCRDIVESGAEFCTALDGSCLLQIGGGLSRRQAGVRPIHLAEILAS
jgi:L-lactate dehydrogenase complex protein LldE